METWKEITIAPFAAISVSSLGRCRYASGLESFGCERKGYRQIALTCGGKQKTFLLHRLVAMAFIPNPRGLPHINHLDGIKSNNRIENLEWCDPKMNAKHAQKMGLTTNRGETHWLAKNPERARRGSASNLFQHEFIGERHPGAKLSSNDVQAIREQRAHGTKLKDIAAKFGVTVSTVCAIARNRRWNHEGLTSAGS